MPGLSRQFRRRVADDLEMWTNQPFTTPLMLGDIGSLSGGRFNTSTATSLQQLGIDIGDPIDGPEFPIRWQANRDGSFEMSVKAKGAPPMGGLAEADIGVSISFGRKGNYLFEARDAKISRIQETAQLHTAIATARAQGKITMQDRIVTSCLTARHAKLYIAETNDAALTLTASAEFTSLLDADVDFKVKQRKGSLLELDVIAPQPVVFFMQLIRVRRWGAMQSVRMLDFITAGSAAPSHGVLVHEESAEALQLEVVSPFDEDDLDV